MIRSLFSGVSGIRNHQIRMDVLSNNISNVNTVGYKAGRANFADGLNQLLQSGGNSRNPMQAGTGVTTVSIGNKMEQGPLQNTGRTLDLAIQGEGFFKVRKGDIKDTDGTITEEGTEYYYTREGTFFVDQHGYLVDSMGNDVIGNEDPTADPPVDQILRFEPTDPATDEVTSIAIASNGTITYYETGEPDTAKFLYLSTYTFTNPEGLKKEGNSYYTADDAITGVEKANVPGMNGVGTVESGYLEMSNTDLSDEFTTMITTQRGYQANSRVVTVSDTLLEELINLKRS